MSGRLSITLLESRPTGRPRLPDMIDDGTGLFTIGELARATGLTVRTRAGFHAQANRYRQLIALVNGREPGHEHAEEFAWVVAALRSRADG